jgi:hypothetical protein
MPDRHSPRRRAILLRVDHDQLADIDAEALGRGTTRTALIRQILREHIAAQPEPIL